MRRRSRIQVDAYPAAGAQVGREEEATRVAVDHQSLVVARCLDPDAVAAPAMVVRRVREHGEEPAADAERRGAPGLDLDCLGERQTELPQPGERTRRQWADFEIALGAQTCKRFPIHMDQVGSGYRGIAARFGSWGRWMPVLHAPLTVNVRLFDNSGTPDMHMPFARQPPRRVAD